MTTFRRIAIAALAAATVAVASLTIAQPASAAFGDTYRPKTCVLLPYVGWACW